MSSDVFANVTRATAPVSGSPIWVQLDEMSQADARAYSGAQAGEGPYDRYSGYTEWPIVLRRGDLLTDQNTVDPDTGANTKYRIIGRPEKFPDGHQEWVCDLVIGT